MKIIPRMFAWVGGRPSHRAGYDIELTRAVSETVTVPVIASGGARSAEDLRRTLVSGKADAVIAARIFHYGICSILEAKEYLAKRESRYESKRKSRSLLVG